MPDNHVYHVSPVAHAFDADNIAKVQKFLQERYNAQMSFLDDTPGIVMVTTQPVPVGEQRRLGLVEEGSAEKL